MPIIKLISSDDIVFEVDLQIIKFFGTIKTMLEVYAVDGKEVNDVEGAVPLPNVNSAILPLVLQWADHHKDDPMPIDHNGNEEERTDGISPWDADFLKVDQGTLFELILAANYLDAKELLDVTCKTVTNMIKGKSSEEIRETFGITNDFTPVEEVQVRTENKWCEEK